MTENPYESPASPASPAKLLPLLRQTRSRSIGSMLILLAMLPAAGIACFTICIAVADNTKSDGFDPYKVEGLLNGSLAGAVGGVIVFGLMLWWGIALSRPFVEKPRGWNKSDGSTFQAYYVSKDREFVTLRYLDGKDVRMPVDQLCEPDREWVAGIGSR